MVTLIAAYLPVVTPLSILAGAYRSKDWDETDDFGVFLFWEGRLVSHTGS